MLPSEYQLVIDIHQRHGYPENMRYYRDDDYDRDYDYDPSEGRVFQRGCTCNVGFNWENGPCDYCNGDYECPDGCGELACECRCDEKCPECGEIHLPLCEVEE